MIKNVGILGGGQLGRMLVAAVHNYGMLSHVYSDSLNSPALDVTSHYTVASYDDEEELKNFAKRVDVLTFEFENLPYYALDVISKYTEVLPGKQILKIAQNRILEKNFLQGIGVGIADYSVVASITALKEINITYPAVLKTAMLGYDGKGQKVLCSNDDIPNDFQFPAVLEQLINFSQELSIVVARTRQKKVIYFPIAENIHKNGVLITSRVPANITSIVRDEVIYIANLVATVLDLNGILAIEFFVVGSRVLVNEIAPRAHNSCHWSMDCCNISQFDALTRVLCNLPLPRIELHTKCIMHNIIGEEISNSFSHLSNKNARLHLYGKDKVATGRKMGHVNILF